MKVLKFLGIAVLAIVVVYLIACAVSPEKVELEYSYQSEVPVEKLYVAAADLNHLQKWNAWSKLDIDSESSVEGNGAEVGDVYKWEGDTVGTGQLTNVEFIENEKIVRKLEFFAPWVSEAEDITTFETNENGTLVKFIYNDNGAGFFMRPIYKMILKAAMDEQMNNGLKFMSEYAAELELSAPKADIIVEELEAIPYVGISKNIEVSEIAATLQEGFANLGAFCQENEAKIAGMPMAIYHTWDGQETDMEAAFPIEGEVAGNADVKFNTIPAGKAVTAVHTGSYESTADTHMEIDAYLEANGLEINGSVYEIYMNDPGQVSPEEIKTKIVYPIK